MSPITRETNFSTLYNPFGFFMYGMPELLRAEFTPKEGRITLTLHTDFRVLDAYGGNLGGRYLGDQQLRGYLEVRNRSILAHGLNPVTKEVNSKLKTIIEGYAAEAVPELKKLTELARFREWHLPVTL
jgi:hypothetical protein